MPTTKVASILLVDDHPLVRRGVGAVLNAEPDLKVVGEAENIGQASEMVETLKPELVVLDLSIGQESGLELIKSLRQSHEHLRMLVLSMHDDSLYAERVLKAGAMGYIRKDSSADRIVAACRKVLSGSIWLSPEVSDRLLRQVTSGMDTHGSPVQRLSDRELEVFRLIGDGASTRDIAERLHLSVKTIETYREHIKSKLGYKDSNELIRGAVHWLLTEQH